VDVDKHIEQYLAQLLPELAHKGVRVDDQRPIDWGCQLRLSSGTEQATLNIYYSPKRGLSAVHGGKKDGPLADILQSILSAHPKSGPRLPGMHTWERWIGSDESGKGDYFGALVVAAFAMDRALEPTLRALGVCDSKLLRDRQICEIALTLHREYPSRINYILIKPAKYNSLYASFKSQGKNLNDLLAWLHASAALDLLTRNPLSEGILVDQFSLARKASAAIKSKSPLTTVIERTGAESDPAVAAASVIARYQFIKHMELMEKVHKMNFPLGASKAVRKAASEYVKAFGEKALGDVAKLHFKTTAALDVISIPGTD
jgi:ribonuclease HIII